MKWGGGVKCCFIMMGLISLFFSTTAEAGHLRIYNGVGLGVFNLNYVEPLFKQKNQVLGTFVNVGADFNDYIALEARLGTTVRGGSMQPIGVAGASQPVTLHGKMLFSGFVKPQYPVRMDFHIYGLVGLTLARLRRDAGALGASEAFKTGLSYGGGAEYFFSEHTGVTAEWVNYWGKVKTGGGTTASIWGATAAIVYHF